ncbi:hypothetical protein Pmar_PMAR027988 [Perkinsus marinus ATCC 50983]|uniref:Uncharacterized protein n=1 Tax=Perkinsus marinus (strain ATCC 50983 / TXsc) TaxID=423536 RepID=C5LV88_PERM5|nr:hypothetical protein Pmar_PMAR027988 [Perkinsus marinus ATCC 50983]EEQ99326.1 hypothetical protein Pmar_PMAR027988 [Perkinsus marinus ATCC 50983]|eukprot:XP_002766609.1 hypothetical protein Pmar_PMAR027988 [Perkinsus marinus ATCC 50983]
MSLQRVIQDIKQLSILSASNVAKFAPRAGYPLVTAILPHILTERKQELLPALPEFGPVDLAYMSNSIANIITTSGVSDSSELLKRFGQQVGEYFSKPGRLEAVPIYSLVTLTNALNRLGYDGGVSRRRGASEDLYARFDRLCCEKIDSMNASDIAVALQSFHNGGCRHAKPSPDLLGKAADRLKGELRQQIPSKSLAQLLNIFVTFGYKQDRELLLLLFDGVLSTPVEDSEIFCAPLALNSLSKCSQTVDEGVDSGVLPSTAIVFNLATKHILPRLNDLGPCQIANVVNALGSLKIFDYRLLTGMSHLIANSDGGHTVPLRTFSFQELSNISHGFAKIAYGSSNLYIALFEEASRREKDFDAQGVSMFLDSVRRVANRWYNGMLRDPNRPGPQPGLQYIPRALMEAISKLLKACEAWSIGRLTADSGGGIGVQSSTQILLCLVELGRGSIASTSPLSKCFGLASEKGSEAAGDRPSVPKLLLASLKGRADRLTKEQTRHIAHAARRYEACDTGAYRTLPSDVLCWVEDIQREFPAGPRSSRATVTS